MNGADVYAHRYVIFTYTEFRETNWQHPKCALSPPVLKFALSNVLPLKCKTIQIFSSFLKPLILSHTHYSAEVHTHFKHSSRHCLLSLCVLGFKQPPKHTQWLFEIGSHKTDTHTQHNPTHAYNLTDDSKVNL